ncbi:MAG TPA: DUF6328 family protein [Candidatus Polarisedimenticolia bacterium]|nr:DUF6328 family protein [Candidatus Polarisedimenticolia bacterium]
MLRPQRADEQEELSLSMAAQQLLEEARTVVPGIQALFGFQLIAVFSATFAAKLTSGEQHLHLLALSLAAIAIALIMTPAAYHRQTGPRRVTQSFIRLSTRLLLASMLPLAVSICIDFYLVGRIIGGPGKIPYLTAGLFAVFLSLWFVLPRLSFLWRAADLDENPAASRPGGTLRRERRVNP